MRGHYGFCAPSSARPAPSGTVCVIAIAVSVIAIAINFIYLVSACVQSSPPFGWWRWKPFCVNIIVSVVWVSIRLIISYALSDSRNRHIISYALSDSRNRHIDGFRRSRYCQRAQARATARQRVDRALNPVHFRPIWGLRFRKWRPFLLEMAGRASDRVLAALAQNSRH